MRVLIVPASNPPEHDHHSFATIAHAIEEGRRIGANIVKFVCHLMTGTGGRLCMFYALFSYMTCMGAAAFHVHIRLFTNQLARRQRGRDAVPDAGAGLPRRRPPLRVPALHAADPVDQHGHQLAPGASVGGGRDGMCERDGLCVSIVCKTRSFTFTCHYYHTTVRRPSASRASRRRRA